jgi:hypothetical protein
MDKKRIEVPNSEYYRVLNFIMAVYWLEKDVSNIFSVDLEAGEIKGLEYSFEEFLQDIKEMFPGAEITSDVTKARSAEFKFDRSSSSGQEKNNEFLSFFELCARKFNQAKLKS